MQLTSSAFTNGEAIPEKYTCDGENISPPLEIKEIPDNTVSMTLIVEDKDSIKDNFTHWILYNISPHNAEIKESVTALEEVIQLGEQGVNDFDKLGYGGPCPGKGEHRYVFKLIALDKILEFPYPISKKEIYHAIEGHVLDKTELMGTYKRKRKNFIAKIVSLIASS